MSKSTCILKPIFFLAGVVMLVGALGLWLLTPAPMMSPTMTQMETAHFVFYFEPAKKAGVAEMARLLEESYGEVTQALQYHPPAKTSVIVYSTQREFQRAARGRILDYVNLEWFIGDNRDDTVLIVSPDIPNRMHDARAIGQTAVHEFVHVLEDAINPALPLYIHEGIALYLAGQRMQYPLNQPLTKLPDADTVFNTRKSFYTSYVFGNNDGYHHAYLLVEYIIHEYGQDKLPQLVRDPLRLEQTLGQDALTVYAGWIEYLKRNYVREDNTVSDWNELWMS